MTEVSTGLMGRCEARVGRTLLGKWRLDQLIDVGGMAAVYAATHRNGNRVAVKILHPELAHIGDLRERFLKEGYVANKIRHRGAVRMLDDDAAEDGSAFIVMELLEGETLHTRMLRHGGRIPVDDLLCVIDKVLEVLVAAHGEQILHRDIKPANIFITLGADVKLLDFGIARVREAAGGIRAPTLPGTVLGTPGFIPPEQALGRMEELDASSDVWAVGATMFAALTGRCVHEAETVNEQIVLAATTPAPPIRSVAPSVPGPVATVIDRALAFRKTYRYDSATAMQAAVQETFHQLQGYRISRGEQMAHVVAELRDLYESGDDSPDEHTTVPKRKWPLRATEPERESEVLAAVEAARRAPSTAPLPGTMPADHHGEAPAPRPSRSNVQATVPAFPIKQHLTPEGIVAPSPKRPPPKKSLLERTSLRAAIFAAAGVAVGLLIVVLYLLVRNQGEALPPIIVLPSSAATQMTSASATAGVPTSPSQPASPPNPTSAEPGMTAKSTSAPRGTGSVPTVASSEKASFGILNINSIPVSRVVLDGRPLGQTPRIGVQVPPGLHQVTFVHPEKGTKVVSISVGPGETRVASAKF